MSTQNFSNEIVNGLTFTNGTITETDTGSVDSFLAADPTGQASTYALGPFSGITWQGLNAGALAPGATLSVDIQYAVTDTNPGQLITGLQDSFTGSGSAGTSLTAIERVYSDAAHTHLIGLLSTNLTQQSNPPILTGDIALTAGYSQVYVDLQVTAAVSATAASNAAVTFSILDQGFVQSGMTLDKQVSADGGKTWLDVGTNNLQDPKVLSGAVVEERVIVVNTGTVAISNASVTDAGGNGPAGFAFGGGNTFSLAAGATVISDVATLSAVAGYQTDTATATGTVSLGGPVTVGSQDSADYTGLTYGVSLDKQISTNGTNWVDVGNGNISNNPTVTSGSFLFERVVMVNTGSVTITNGQVTDTGSGPTDFTVGGSTSFTLAAGATVTSDVATITAVSGTESDIATLTGTVSDSYGNTATVSASDTAGYFGTSGGGGHQNAPPGIALDKQISVDGTTWVDVNVGNLAQNPTVLAGSSLYERVIVENTGTDAVTGTVSDTGGNGPASFTFGNTSTFSLVGGTAAAGNTIVSDVATIVAGSGYQLDTATATGTDTTVTGPITVSATDQANYTGETPSITLDKQISADGGSTWADVGNGVTSGNPTVLTGSTLLERVVVVNTGSIAITGAQIGDTGAGPADFTVGGASSFTLAAGATITSDVATITAQSGTESDTAKVTGTASDSYGNTATVSASDTAGYIGVTPTITLDKQISADGGSTWADIGNGVTSANPTVLTGSTLLERVVVVNTGSIAITGAQIGDTGAGPADFTVGGASSFTLAAGATITSDVATITAQSGTESDTAKVTGTASDSYGNTATVSASDTAGYIGVTPTITLDKQISTDGTNWVDVGNGNLTQDPSVSPGSAVFERVIVANTGSVAISGAHITDVGGNGPAGFTVSGSNSFSLAAGATITSDVATISAASGYQLDTATVTGTASDNFGHTETVSASDQANYTGTTPGLSVIKLPCQVVVGTCGQVTYTYDVTNTGSTPLTHVQIADNIGTAAHPDLITPAAVLKNGYNVGDTNHNGILDAGETWQYTNTINESGNCVTQGGSQCHTVSGDNLGSGCTAWLNSNFTPTSCEDGATYNFKDISCTITDSHGKTTTVKVPDACVTFSKGCTQPTTHYDSTQNCWITTLPANCSPGKVFLSGLPYQVPSDCNLSGSSVTWNIGDSSNNCGASNLSWQAGCAGYSNFDQNGCNGSSDYNQIGVKVCDNSGSYGNGGNTNQGYGWNFGGDSNSYCGTTTQTRWGGSQWSGSGSDWNGSSSDCAGTPENQYTASNCGSGSSNSGSGGWSGGSGWGSSSWGNGGSGSGSGSSSGISNCGSSTGNCIQSQTVCDSALSLTVSGSNVGSGSTAWLNSSFTPTSCKDGASYTFKDISCTITDSHGKTTTVKVPDACVTFSKNCTQPTTHYDSTQNCWVTTLPADCSPGKVFLSGLPYQVPSGCSLSGATVTWNIGESANNCGSSSIDWQAGCTGYSSFDQNGCNGSNDYNQIGVKVCDNSGGYGNGGNTDQGYGWNFGGDSNGYCGTSTQTWWGGSQWSGSGSDWSGSSSDCAGTPENQYTGNNCSTGGNDGGSAYGGWGSFGGWGGSGCSSGSGGSSGGDQGTCGNGSASGTCSQGQLGTTSEADTVTATATTSSGATITASDSKEVQVLASNSNITVNGTAPTGSLSQLYGTAQTLEFAYNPGNTVSLVQGSNEMASVIGSNSNAMAFIEISNNANPFAANARIYFQGEVVAGEKIFADATLNQLTNTPVAAPNNQFSTMAGSDLYAFVFNSQADFQNQASAVQKTTYGTGSSLAMHLGDTVGSLKLMGYIGSNGGYLVS